MSDDYKKEMNEIDKDITDQNIRDILSNRQTMLRDMWKDIEEDELTRKEQQFDYDYMDVDRLMRKKRTYVNLLIVGIIILSLITIGITFFLSNTSLKNESTKKPTITEKSTPQSLPITPNKSDPKSFNKL